MSLNMKSISEFTPRKIWISRCDVHAREQKQHAQFGRSTRSALDIFNALRVFTQEPENKKLSGVQESNIYDWDTKSFA